MTPRLNSDVKERICQLVHSHQAYVQGVGAMSSPHRMQFTGVNFILTHVDSEWRHIAIRYAWHTVHFDDCFPNIAFSEMQALYGHHTRKICTTVRFRGIISHYRRYSMTEENEDLQPFCDLHKWPRLQELDITYAQKCAFPGLANYLEPRLANIRKITVRGRIPIDMRRAAMFLNSPKLKEIHICAFLREDDPVSAITTRNDPILLMPIATGLSTIRLTTSIDIRIINAVLCAGRHQLLKVELIGLCPTQLIASGLSLASPTRKDASLSLTEEKDGRIWKSLAVLSIRLCTHTLHGTPARIYLDATEFPRLQCLKFTECSSLIPDSELPLNIAYGQSFSNKWPKLCYLYRSLQHS
ncbi:hypothetical protein EV177_006443 [Coemansia sp. RSA 1804]|nr:hypothetical protein EV177_006443 [Coemansia sp. RSA 1804]